MVDDAPSEGDDPNPSLLRQQRRILRFLRCGETRKGVKATKQSDGAATHSPSAHEPQSAHAV